MQSVKIVLMAVGAGICYGIVHDQVTARLCVEYFTLGHPPLFPTQSPTLLAIGWGVVATWWVALPLGVALAVAARLGPLPKREPRELLRPLAVLLGCMAVAAATSGAIGYANAQHGATIDPWVETHIPSEKQAFFIADWWAHSASYLSGAVGGLFLCAYVWLERRRAGRRTAGSRVRVLAALLVLTILAGCRSGSAPIRETEALPEVRASFTTMGNTVVAPGYATDCPSWFFERWTICIAPDGVTDIDVSDGRRSVYSRHRVLSPRRHREIAAFLRSRMPEGPRTIGRFATDSDSGSFQVGVDRSLTVEGAREGRAEFARFYEIVRHLERWLGIPDPYCR